MFRHLFTGIDNQTFDLGRVLWAVLAVAFVVISSHAYTLSHAVFDPLTWSAGAAAILAAGAAAQKVKESTEPPANAGPPSPSAG
jgi:hypothetical protein